MALPCALSPNDPLLEKEVVGKLRKMMAQSRNPIIIVDGFAVRNNLQNQCQKISRLTGFPTFNTYMSKGGIDETMPNFGGLYTGAGTYDGLKNSRRVRRRSLLDRQRPGKCDGAHF